jgi:methyl-accepting chemotaxis protein
MSSFSLRLTHKITAIGIIGVAGVILVAGMHMYGESALAVYRDAAERSRTIFELNSRIEIELLEGRRAEKDFLLRNDSKKAESQIEISKSVVSDIDALRVKIVALGQPDLARQIEGMSNSLKQYQTHFLAVVEHRRQLGMDEKSGLEGRLRASVHGIESQIDQLHEPALLITMLMMRRHEKDFMLRREAKYGDEMKKRATEFAGELAGAPIPAATKEDITKKLTAYQRDFVAWMAGANDLASAQKATSAAYATIEPVIEGVQQTIDQVRAKAEAAEQCGNSRQVDSM